MNPNLEQVWNAIDPERLRSTLMEMIDIYSPSGKEEDIQLYLEERLEASGIPVARAWRRIVSSALAPRPRLGWL